jgi:hypothetical protein
MVGSVRINAPIMLMFLACSSSKTAERPPPPPPARPAPPSGPTRTDFQTIAKTLVKECVAGGWISRWRSDHENVDVAKPKIYLADFEMVTAAEGSDFVGRGRLLRLAERASGKRFSVYTVTLDLLRPDSSEVAYSCEATVQGEL